MKTIPNIIQTAMRVIFTTALGIVTVTAPNTNANELDTSRSDFTFVAKPYAQTSSYMIYEVGFKTQVSGAKSRYDGANHMLTVDLGMMHNLNEKTSIGASLFASAGDRPETVGIKPRIRHWLDETRGLDLSAGLLITGGGGGYPYYGNYKWPGFIGSASIDLFRWLSVDLSIETLRGKDYRSYLSNGTYGTVKGQSETSLYLGVNGKDYAALAGTGFLAVGVVIALAAWSSGSGW